jgi:2-keto-3-deoxy-L-rhamnonate aldolase RhmA
MQENRAKKKMAAGEVAWGVMVPWDSPDMVEFFGHLGFDWIFIDSEHAVIGPETCQDLVRACQLSGMTPIVRVYENSEGTILRYLETGALGIIVPHVNTAEDAQAAVNAVKYWPIGRRGAGSTTRAANYGLTQTATEYFAQANEQLLVVALIEEYRGIEKLDEILAVEGLDGIAIGPGDLSMSMGMPGQASHPDVQKLLLDATKRSKVAGKFVSATVGDAASARASADNGAQLIFTSVPSLLGSAGREFLGAVKAP